MNKGFFVLGVAFLIVGVIMYAYTQSTEGLYFAPPLGVNDRPYATMGIVIIVLGLIVMVAGAFTPSVTRKIVTNEVEHHPKRKVIVKEEKL
jgi:hypothetical protein